MNFDFRRQILEMRLIGCGLLSLGWQLMAKGL